MKISKICFIGNIAAYYRKSIFEKMLRELNCDFYFGIKIKNKNIKTLSDDFFGEHGHFVENIYLLNTKLYWQKGVLKNIFGDYDAIIASGDFFCLSTWSLCLLGRIFSSKKIILWTHGWYNRETFSKVILKKIFFSFAHRILLYGNYAKKSMIAAGYEPQKLWVIHNSLDHDRQRKIMSQLSDSDVLSQHFRNKNKTIVFSGRLIFEKHLEMILISMVNLQKKYDCAVNCVLIGDGPAMESLKRFAEENDISSRVWFYGACYDEKIIGQIYREATVCVSPGNVGLTAIHAMTFGCPVITHGDFPRQGPEFESVKPNVTGDFFAYGNQAELDEILYKWAKLTDEQRSEISLSCQKEIEENWTPAFQLNVLRQCLASLE